MKNFKSCFLNGSLTPLGLFVTKIGLFALILSPAVAHCQTVTWTSSAPSVATVNSTTGTITAKTEGTTTITNKVTQNAKTITSTKTILVEWEPQSGSISGISSLASCKATGTMTATVNYGTGLDDIDGSDYTWKSSNTNVATVSNTNKTKNLKSITITAKRNGSATISCSVERNGKILSLDSRTVSVSGINPTFKINSTANISFTSTSSNVYRYASHTYPSGCTGTTPTFTYSSDNSRVATWSSSYVRKGSTSGSTRVRVSSSNVVSWSSSIYVSGNYLVNICGRGPITINGVKWAQCNLGASSPTSYGSCYTWENRHRCPTGWRLPTKAEWIALDNRSGGVVSNPGDNQNSGGGILGTYNGVAGRWYSGTKPPRKSGVFFPHGSAGCAHGPTYTVHWYSINVGYQNSFTLIGNQSMPGDYANAPNYVRCVVN